ncbi:MAG TPA: Fic family protein [Bryobacteraceae bacterium]|jgi:Fic family protein
MNQRLGTYFVTSEGGETVRSFIPPPLPPNPHLRLEPFLRLLEQANQALGRLDGLSAFVSVPLFLYNYVRKEAVLSSQIEGTQSSLSDLLLFEGAESPGVPTEDVQEVSNYLRALDHGLERMKDLPLSLRLIREIHGKLLAKGRGSDKDPGEFRRSQNWIGGTRPGNAAFVPPPAHRVLECMGQLELFLHEERPDLPLLVKAAIAHVQFESIHPFLDGNGRVGRLLITLLLVSGGAIRRPILYLSLYFKENRDRYYELLNQVRSTGDWEGWIEFFLIGVRDTATQAIAAADRILALIEEDRRQISTIRTPPSVILVFQQVQRNPILSVQQASKGTGVSFPTASRAFEALKELGIVGEITGKARGRLYTYTRYLDLLSEGTQPLPK